MGGIGISYYPIGRGRMISFHVIDKKGTVPYLDFPLSDTARDVCELFQSLYATNGFLPPWIGYVGVSEGNVVCAGGFKSPPRDGVVEIGYATFPGYHESAIGNAMAHMLVHIASSTDPGIRIQAHTQPEGNSSVEILRKHGFQFAGAVEDDQRNTVWRWLRSGKAQ